MAPPVRLGDFAQGPKRARTLCFPVKKKTRFKPLVRKWYRLVFALRFRSVVFPIFRFRFRPPEAAAVNPFILRLEQAPKPAPASGSPAGAWRENKHYAYLYTKKNSSPKTGNVIIAVLYLGVSGLIPVYSRIAVYS